MRNFPARSSRSSAFTLIELLVVVGVIGTLVSLLLPAVLAARRASARTACQSNLRQIGVAVAGYAAANNLFPPGQVRSHQDGDTYAWSYEILPYLEAQAIYDRIDKRLPMTSNVNKGTPDAPGPVTEVISVYLCPSTAARHPSRDESGRIVRVEGCAACEIPWATETTVPSDAGDAAELRPMGRLGAMDYVGISGPHHKVLYEGEPYGQNRGVFVGFKSNEGSDPRFPKTLVYNIPDGESNTLMVIECTGQGWFVNDYGNAHGVWAHGKNIGSVGRIIDDPLRPGSPIDVRAINMRSEMMSPPEMLAWANEAPRSDHPGGVNALAADGRVVFLNEDVDVILLRHLASRNGGEFASLDALAK